MAKNTLIVNIPDDLYQKFIATVTAEGGLWRRAESSSSAIESAVFAALMLFLQGLGLSGDLPEFRDYVKEKYPYLDEDLVTMIADLIDRETVRLRQKG